MNTLILKLVVQSNFIEDILKFYNEGSFVRYKNIQLDNYKFFIVFCGKSFVSTETPIYLLIIKSYLSHTGVQQ